PDPLIEANVDADLGEILVDLLVADVAREAPGRDARGEHATGDRQRLVDDDLVPLQAEIACAGQTGRTGSDDGDALLLGDRDASGRTVLLPIVRRDPLQAANSDWLVDASRSAGRLAGAGAHPAEQAREDVVLQVDLVGRVVVLGRDVGDVAGDVG